MASGKAIGEFSLKMITATIVPGPAGSLLNQVNWEGTGTGFGATFLTATFIGGGKDGTLTFCYASYLDNGDAINGGGQGTGLPPDARQIISRVGRGFGPPGAVVLAVL